MKNVKASSANTPVDEFLVSRPGTSDRRRRRRTRSSTGRAHRGEDAGGDAEPGAEHGRDQRERQEPIGVAQDALTVRSQRRAVAETAGLRLEALVGHVRAPHEKSVSVIVGLDLKASLKSAAEEPVTSFPHSPDSLDSPDRTTRRFP
ncbi:hypothetical protein Ddc_23475 [Ditylenchus destructor]|nr:hypothetical protein Ddc_23475 [Ditylenchus destructor]